MSLKDIRYDGSEKLNVKNLATGIKASKKEKEALILKTAENMARAAELQEKLYAAGREGLVIAIQARDAAGKDSLVRKVFGMLNPAALQIHAFKSPSKEELSHDYLWRINRALPPRGTIGVFNRSQYEDVLVTRVHQMEKGYSMPARVTEDEEFYKKRYVQLRNWEQYLFENGYRMVKVFLNVGQEEQKQRFIDRMTLPEKHWKLSLGDMDERALWDEYDEAYEDAINHTATPEAPWYVIPADNKWYARYLMSEILLETLTAMAPEYPELDAEQAERVPEVLAALRGEETN